MKLSIEAQKELNTMNAMQHEKTGYGIPQANQLVQCPECKEHIEVCDAVLVSGKEYCDGCAEFIQEWLKQFERFIDTDTEYLEFEKVKVGDNVEARAYVRNKTQGDTP
ncbi:hypothetical protein GZ77_07280 [Endozoicomonas montiporae]|uniref:Uncharacterized protein n=2 Tax=Endozoicomonas montiporae TaxID=1027273 RepID=A0A081N6Z5_9GAMM|nr:hypothetical protein [Endozoicomonas montiporae]AMO55974.1 hypothetical protein EZMO1_1831 [Endozoicomonas montiporae CL-33]KEQ14218.1 hypothetical protein GZ77_07280 [Endozoicomonas montiporae]